jgi:thiamine kinase-like enzyme
MVAKRPELWKSLRNGGIATDGRVMDEAEQAARQALSEIGTIARFDGPLERMGGLTNIVFRAGAHVLRLPGRGTEEYINRANEAVAAREAARAGVSPELVHVDPVTGIMVTRFIEGAVTLSPEGFRARRGAPARAGTALARLHRSGVVFPFRFELFAMIDDYLAILATKDIVLPAGYHDVVAEAQSIRRSLEAATIAPVACHCDPLCENFLDTGERVWIVDWEYSGMNDPMWDLGDLSVEGQFGPDQDEEMLAAYFGGEAPPAERSRMVIYKAMCDLLWTLWGLIQLANGNPADDFRNYANTRFSRCKALMAAPQFGEHRRALEAIRA